MDISRVRSQLADNLARQPAKFFSPLPWLSFIFSLSLILLFLLFSFDIFFLSLVLFVFDSFSNDDDYSKPAGGLLLNRDWVRLRRHLPLLLI